MGEIEIRFLLSVLQLTSCVVQRIQSVAELLFQPPQQNMSCPEKNRKLCMGSPLLSVYSIEILRGSFLAATKSDFRKTGGSSRLEVANLLHVYHKCGNLCMWHMADQGVDRQRSSSYSRKQKTAEDQAGSAK